jgi:hypothetical protein
MVAWYAACNDGTDRFTLLLKTQSDAVASTVIHIQHKDALVRMACVEAWRILLAKSPSASAW